MELIVDPSGNCRCVYSEDIDLSRIGKLDLHRASHVEPDPEGHWWADLCPVLGPRLGPFQLRSEAIAAELRWLETYWLRNL